MCSFAQPKVAALPLLAWFLFWVAGPASGAEPEPAPAVIDQLIQQLGHDEFGQREDASRRLVQIGEPALAALRRAATAHADAEIKHRAATLVRKIEKELRGELLTFGNGSSYWLNRVAFTPDG